MGSSENPPKLKKYLQIHGNWETILFLASENEFAYCYCFIAANFDVFRPEQLGNYTPMMLRVRGETESRLVNLIVSTSSVQILHLG